jgi:hypothetical protein
MARRSGSGGTSATSVTVVNETTITCRPPTKSSGLHTIRVTRPDTQFGELTNGYRAWTPSEITGVDGYFDSRKAVTLDTGTEVNRWTEQSRSVNYISQPGLRPNRVADVFGTGIPAVRFAPPNQRVLATARSLASGFTGFWVGAWTSTDSTPTTTVNPPLTLIGDNTAGSAVIQAGASAGSLAYRHYTGVGSTLITAGSGLNDGATRLVGFTHDASTSRHSALMISA